MSAIEPAGGVTLVRNARWLVAWDEASGRHVYRTDADLAFEDGAITHVGPGYAGSEPATTIDASGCMVMPGLVNIHSHPSSEALNKGFLDELG